MPRGKLKFKSKFEKETFDWLKRRRLKPKYEHEKIPYIQSGHYTPDFIIETENGKIYIETKGYFPYKDRAKMVAVKKCHPTLDIRFVFYRLVKAYIKWCEKYGFPWAIEKVPIEWIKSSQQLSSH